MLYADPSPYTLYSSQLGRARWVGNNCNWIGPPKLQIPFPIFRMGSHRHILEINIDESEKWSIEGGERESRDRKDE